MEMLGPFAWEAHLHPGHSRDRHVSVLIAGSVNALLAAPEKPHSLAPRAGQHLHFPGAPVSEMQAPAWHQGSRNSHHNGKPRGRTAAPALQCSDIPGFPFFRKGLQHHTNHNHNLKYHCGFFSSFAFKNCSLIESTGILKARECALHDEILKDCSENRTGACTTRTLEEFGHMSNISKHQEKK